MKAPMRRKGDLRLIVGGLNITWVARADDEELHAVIDCQIMTMQDAYCGAAPRPGDWWDSEVSRGRRRCSRCVEQLRREG